MQAKETDAKETPEQAIDALGLSVSAEFVPWSKANHWEGDDGKNLNRRAIYWRIAVSRDGREFYTGQYAQGIGHLPKQLQIPFGRPINVALAEAIEKATETGKATRDPYSTSLWVDALKPPRATDVLYSLVSDADAIECSGFEEWASNLGYDTDSRKAEQTYRACLDIGLKFQNALNYSGLERLREAFQDY